MAWPLGCETGTCFCASPNNGRVTPDIILEHMPIGLWATHPCDDVTWRNAALRERAPWRAELVWDLFVDDRFGRALSYKLPQMVSYEWVGDGWCFVRMDGFTRFDPFVPSTEPIHLELASELLRVERTLVSDARDALLPLLESALEHDDLNVVEMLQDLDIVLHRLRYNLQHTRPLLEAPEPRVVGTDPEPLSSPPADLRLEATGLRYFVLDEDASVVAAFEGLDSDRAVAQHVGAEWEAVREVAKTATQPWMRELRTGDLVRGRPIPTGGTVALLTQPPPSPLGVAVHGALNSLSVMNVYVEVGPLEFADPAWAALAVATRGLNEVVVSVRERLRASRDVE